MSDLWYNLTPEEVLAKTDSSSKGLSSKEAKSRLAANGLNEIKQEETKSLLGIFITQFSDLMIWVLIGAAVVSGLVGEWVDAAIILVVVLLNAILGTVEEHKAEKALAALKDMAAPMATVRRSDRMMVIPARELVSGDIVQLETGNSVPADLRIIEEAGLKIEESALTGESVSSEKTAVVLGEQKLPVGDRANMAFLGTSVTSGRGIGVVVAVGMDTEMGSIASQLATVEKEITPLQRKLNQISNILSLGVIAIAAVIFLIGLLSGREMLTMFLTAVSLAVAAIPEGLVAVVTIVLAIGMSRMAAKGAIIRRLPAVETLGSTQIICSDKTGTLTQNKMTVKKLFSKNKELLHAAMGHCNDSKLDRNGKLLGDPTETALIDYLLKEGLWSSNDISSRSRVGHRSIKLGLSKHGNNKVRLWQ